MGKNSLQIEEGQLLLCSPLVDQIVYIRCLFAAGAYDEEARGPQPISVRVIVSGHEVFAFFHFSFGFVSGMIPRAYMTNSVEINPI